MMITMKERERQIRNGVGGEIETNEVDWEKEQDLWMEIS